MLHVMEHIGTLCSVSHLHIRYSHLSVMTNINKDLESSRNWL